MNGIDVSGWQPGNICDMVDYDFVIIKATQGSAFVSKTFQEQVSDAIARGKKIGLYHFDNGDANWRAEVDYFVDKVKPYIGKAIMVWDWEASAISKGSDRLKNILAYLKDKIGYAPVLYASGSPLVNSGGNAAAAANNCGVWCANYSLGYQQVNGYRTDLKPYTACMMHQYTSSGRLTGYSGNLDLNRFFGDSAAWDKYANQTAQPATPSKPAKVHEPVPNFQLPGRGYWKYKDVDPKIGVISGALHRLFPSYVPEGATGNRFGPILKSAVHEFQTRAKADGQYNAAVDDKIGPKTLAALKHYWELTF